MMEAPMPETAAIEAPAPTVEAPPPEPAPESAPESAPELAAPAPAPAPTPEPAAQPEPTASDAALAEPVQEPPPPAPPTEEAAAQTQPPEPEAAKEAPAAEDDPAREPGGGHDLGEAQAEAPPPAPSEPAPIESALAAPSLVWTDGWHPAIPEQRRLKSPNCRSRNGVAPSRIVVHITGTADFESARKSFMNSANQQSAHYCIDRNGDLYQFVSEDDVAWHAGIHRTVDPVYARRDGSWRKYKRYFHWHKGYPGDAVFLDASGKPAPKENAVLVARGDGSPWPDYDYFDKRWGAKPEPLGYDVSKAVNLHTIGIETVGFGGPSGAAYTEAMYATLASLVADICARRNIPRKFGPVCGHEDVNPVERWGWDPGQGFDWSRVVET